MKKFNIFFIGIISMLFMASCESSPGVEPNATLTIALETEAITFQANELTYNYIQVVTNDKEWTATKVGDSGDWLDIYVDNTNNRLKVTTKSKNTDLLPRMLKIALATKDKTSKDTLEVYQLGESPTITANKKEFILGSEASIIALTVVTNLNYEIVYSVGWIEEEFSRSVFSYNHKFKVPAHSGVNREGRIIIRDRDKPTVFADTVVVIQSGSRDIYAKDREFRPVAGRASAHTPYADSYKFENSFDGNLNSFFLTAQDAAAFPLELEYDMPTNANRLDHFTYEVTYDTSNIGINPMFGFMNTFDVYYNTRENDTFVKYGSFSIGNTYYFYPSTFYFDTPIINPKTIKFVINAPSGNCFRCYEMRFHAYPEAYNTDVQAAIDRVFVNSAYMELKPGATDSDIKLLPTELMDIAKKLKANTYPKEFRCQSYKPYTSAATWGTTNVTRPFSDLNNPTGIGILAANETFSVFAGPLHGNIVELIRVESLHTAKQTFILREGVNTFTATGPGQLYVRYIQANLSAANAKPVDIHFPENKSGTVYGYFNIEKHQTVAELTRLLNAVKPLEKPAGCDVFVLQGKYVQLNFLTSDLTATTPQSVLEGLKIWDEMVWWEWEAIGIDKQFPAQRNNRQLACSGASGGVYATEYFTFFQSSSVATMFPYPNSSGTFPGMWGPSHEFGHQNDQAFTWHGYTESSNNFFSNLIRYKHQTKYSQTSVSGGPGLQYLNDFTFVRGLNFMDFAFYTDTGNTGTYNEDGLFLISRLLWQLYLYHHEAGVDPEFFPKFCAYLRVNRVNSTGTPQEKSMKFYKAVCDFTQKDYTEFFETWGWFNLLDKNINQYTNTLHRLTAAMVSDAQTYVKNKGYAPAPPIQFIEERTTIESKWTSSLGNVGLVSTYKNNLKITDAGLSYTKSGSTVTITGGGNAVGFEIRDGSSTGKLKGISVRTTFTTSILTGTNKLYAVQADGVRFEVPLK